MNSTNRKCSYLRTSLRMLLLSSFIGLTNANNSTALGVNNANKIFDGSHKDMVGDYVLINMSTNLQQKFSTANDLDFTLINKDVLYNNKKYLIDFSEIKSVTEKNIARKRFYDKASPVSFDSDFIFISRYKNKLMYTPTNAEHLQDTLKELNQQSMIQSEGLGMVTTNSNVPMPSVAFYIQVSGGISKDDCSFPTFYGPHKDDDIPSKVKEFCNNQSMNLIYLVSYARSLPFGGSGAPDAKIVRITLDGGNGISLNKEKPKLLYTDYYGSGGGLHSVVFRTYASSAIAQDYTFEIKPLNELATIHLSQPENLNRNYQNTHMSTSKYGIVPKVSLSTEPGFSLTGSAEFTETRSLTFDTQDYAITKTPTGANSVSFKWARDPKRTADSFLKFGRQQAWWVEAFPLDLSPIQPISYLSFAPKLDVVYKAASDTVGETTFSIDSSVLIRPLLSRSIFAGLFGLYFEGIERDRHWKRAKVTKTFNVNWNHPVFLGGWPVSIQLNKLNKCVGITPKTNNIEVLECNLNEINQSFMYDKQLRYRSVQDMTMCLDAVNLDKLEKCNSSITQQWKWSGNSLINQHLNERVIYRTSSNGGLLLSDPEREVPEGHSAILSSSFTNIINQ